MPGSRFLIAAFGLFFLFAVAAGAEISFGGGDGSSQAQAIIIKGASGESDGVHSEYEWVKQNRHGAEILGQALLMKDDRAYDMLTIRLNGVEEEIFFDITAFFGK
jgi:uncharacterized protein YhfF